MSLERSKYIITITLFLSLILAHWQGDWFYAQKVGLAFLLTLFLSLHFLKTFRFSICLLFAYCLSSALWGSMWPDNKFNHLGLEQLIVYAAILRGTLLALLIWCVVTFEPVKRYILEDGFLALGGILCVHFFFLRRFFAPDGILMTPTLEATFLCLTLPLAFSRCKWLAWAFVGTILSMKGMTGYASLGALAWAWVFWRQRAIAIYAGLLIAIPVALIGIQGHWDWFYGPKHGQGRPEVWAAIWKWWKLAPEYHWLGVGAGSGYSMIPFIQKHFQANLPYLFMFMHNEYFQALFELGYVGCALVGITALDAFSRTILKSDFRGFAFLCALIPACFSMFPFRHDVLLFFCVLEISRFMKKKHQDEFKYGRREDAKHDAHPIHFVAPS